MYSFPNVEVHFDDNLDLASKTCALIILGSIIQFSYDNWDFKFSVDPWGI
jgi:hypothetical protein